jgi:hypothetical protein
MLAAEARRHQLGQMCRILCGPFRHINPLDGNAASKIYGRRRTIVDEPKEVKADS